MKIILEDYTIECSIEEYKTLLNEGYLYKEALDYNFDDDSYDDKKDKDKQMETTKEVVAKDKEHLGELIRDAIEKYGNKCDLNFINVSHVTDMSWMFCRSRFNGDISKWDVSNVKDMSYMFSESKFNGDISNWDVSNVNDMSYMFYNSNFNGDISKWHINNMKYMDIFKECPIEESNKPKAFQMMINYFKKD